MGSFIRNTYTSNENSIIKTKEKYKMYGICHGIPWNSVKVSVYGIPVSLPMSSVLNHLKNKSIKKNNPLKLKLCGVSLHQKSRNFAKFRIRNYGMYGMYGIKKTYGIPKTPYL
jgi:hypothetical protein